MRLVGIMKHQFITSQKFVITTDVVRGWLMIFIASVLKLGVTTNLFAVGSLKNNTVIQFNFFLDKT